MLSSLKIFFFELINFLCNFKIIKLFILFTLVYSKGTQPSFSVFVLNLLDYLIH